MIEPRPAFVSEGYPLKNRFDAQLSSFNSLIYIYAKCSESGFSGGPERYTRPPEVME